MFDRIIPWLFVWSYEVFVLLLFLFSILLFFQIVDEVFRVICLFILNIVKNWLFSEVQRWKSLVLKGSVNFFAHIFQHLRFISLLVKHWSVLCDIVENIAVMSLFLLLFNVRENGRTFLSGYWNILFVFKDSFYFLVFKLFFLIIKTLH